jgi:hypothetical protein
MWDPLSKIPDRPIHANLGSPLLVRQPRKLVLNRLTPLFVYGNPSIEKNLNGFGLIFRLKVWD